MNATYSEDDRPTRRLSAVMFTDMVGYSDLVQRNESLGLEMLAEQRTIVRDILPRYEGREVDTAGDAFFVEFASALEAVQCAVEIQTTFHRRNDAEPPDRRIVLRIGLHLGDVVHIGGQVQGDGVNIAARMEPLARPGSICVSEDVARQIHNKIDLPVAPLGSRKLKNIRLRIDAYRIVMPWEDDYTVIRPFHEFAVIGSGRRRLPLSKSLRVLAAIALVAVVGWLAASRLYPGGLEVEPNLPSSLVAVLPFSVQGSPEFDYLGKGMVDLLSTKLDGAGSLKTVDPRAILGLVSQSRQEILDPTGAREIARRLGAGTYVMGNIVQVGGHLRIDATVYSGNESAQAEKGTVEGEASEIFNLLDQLAAQLVIVKRGGPGVQLEGLQSMTTSSFDALKHYLQGVDAFRAARFQTASDELLRAVEEDSTFSLAWYQLSATADWLFDPLLASESIQMADRYSDRLSERGRRLVRALRAAKTGRHEEAFQLYREFLSSYPDDVEAWYQLGELTFHNGPMIGIPPEESLEAWRRLLFFEPDQVTALIHVARIWQFTGELSLVDSVAAVIFELEPDAERNVELRTHLAFNRKDPQAIEDATRQLGGAGDDMLMEVLWSVASFRDDFRPAMTISSVLTEPTRPLETRGVGFVAQAYLQASAGRFEDAEAWLDKASEIGNQEVPVHRAFLALLPFRSPSRATLSAVLKALDKWPAENVSPSSKSSGWYSAHNGIHPFLRDYLKGVADAVLTDSAGASRMASRLESANAPEQTGSLLPDLAKGIRAQMRLSAGDLEGAERILSRQEKRASYQFAVGSPFFSVARERFERGRLLEDLADFDEAVLAMSFFEGHTLYDLVFAAPSHLRRAKVYEKLGDRSRELQHLQKFVEQWGACDEEMDPLVRAARERIAELSI